VIKNLTIQQHGHFEYQQPFSFTEEGAAPDYYKASAGFPLFIIRMAWDANCDMENLADGYGPGLGTMGGDWSGIRDSSQQAIERMLEKALNFIQEKVYG